MKKLLKRYMGFLVLLAVSIILIFINREIGLESMQISGSNLLEMIQILPPVFILLGLMDVWVPREVMIKLMGEGSGIHPSYLTHFIRSRVLKPVLGYNHKTLVKNSEVRIICIF